MNKKNHHILPFVLIRSSPHNIKDLNSLKDKKLLKTLTQINRLQKRINKIKSLTIEILYKNIPITKSKQERNILLIVKRSLMKDTSISKVLLNLRLKATNIIKKLNKIEQLRQDLENLNRLYHELFRSTIKKEKDFITNQISKNHDLIKGICLSSPDICKNIHTMRDKVLLSVLKYITRTYTKTSPFSSLTQIGIININKNNINIKNKRLVRLNIHLLKILEQSLLNHQSLCEILIVKLNNSIKINSEYFTFLKIKDNQEVFQTIKSTPFLQHIYLKIKTKNFTFNELATQLNFETNKSKNFLHEYLHKLIDFGFITVNTDISMFDDEWDYKFLNLLQQNSTNSIIKKIIPSFEKIIKIKKNFLEDSHLYTNIQAELYKEFIKVFKVLNIDSTLLLTIKDHPFIYEDIAFQSKLKINENSIKDINQSLLAYTNCLLNEEKFNEVRINLKEFFINTYGKDSSIDFLTFYKDYQKNYKKKYKIQAVNSLYNNFLRTYVKKDSNLPNKLYFDLKYLDTNKNISFNFFIQKYTEKNNQYYVLNNITSGNGKAFSRFLDLFDKEITQYILNSNKSQYSNSITIENHDLIYSNLFFKPSITEKELSLPGYSLLDEKKAISLLDIEVKIDKNNNDLILLNKKKNKQITILNLDLIHIDYRNPIFQFLNLFSPQRYVTISSPLKQINNHYQINENLTILPRIIINNNLIVQRKKWKISKKITPQKKYNEKLEEFFLRVNSWQNNLNLPHEVFISLSREDKTVQDEDLFKPQYIDFRVPLLIDIFNKLVNKSSDTIEITEMLPNSSMINKKDHNNKVMELVFQSQI